MISDNTYNIKQFYFWDIETSKVPIDGKNITFDKYGEEIFEKENYIQVPYLSNIYIQCMKTGRKIDSIFHRTINDFVEYMKEESQDQKIVVYVHNLDYELSFLLRQTKASAIINTEMLDNYGMYEFECILRDKHSPLVVSLDILPNVLFKDSYALFNKSVAQLGEDLIDRGENLPKLDYNYKEVRLPTSKLKTLDYNYNERDNIIVARSIFNYIRDRGYTEKNIPITFTGATKMERRKFIKKHYKDGALKSLNMDKYNALKDYNFYRMTLDAFQGGTTGASPNTINIPFINVLSYDIKSSYPAQMARKKFPIFLEDTTYYFEGEGANDIYHDFLHLIHHEQLGTIDTPSPIKGYYIRCIIEGLEIKDKDYILPLSSSFCGNDLSIEDAIIINGKVQKANRVEITCNNVFLDTLNATYSYDNIFVYEMYATDKDRHLREGEISFLLNGFDNKENKLKDSLEYALAKVNINAQFGIKVQKTIKDKTFIIDGITHKIEFNELDENFEGLGVKCEDVYTRHNLIEENKYNSKGGKFTKDFDLFTDGTYITEYGRHQLMTMMIKFNDYNFKPNYADTDSLKIYKKNSPSNEKENNEKFIKKFNFNDITIINDIVSNVNEQILTDNRNNIRFQGYKETFEVTEDNYNKILNLGIWESETEIKNLEGKKITSPYTFFKSLGAKKYALVKHFIYKDDDKIKEMIKNVYDKNEYRHGDLVPWVETTIAGCSKKVNIAIMRYANINNLSYDKALNIIFDNGTLFDKTCSGRMIAYREDREFEECMSFTYKGEKLKSAGGIVLQETTYLLNVSKSDSNVLGIDRDETPIRILNDKGELKYYEY